MLLYIDPGMGSLAVQAVVAGFAAFIFFFKNTFRKIFGKKEKLVQEEEENKNSF